MPALGSPALGHHIDSQGWEKFFTSYALPEDPIPRMHLSGNPRGVRSDSDTIRNEDREMNEKLVETLYKEETSSSSDGGSGNNTKSNAGNAIQVDNADGTSTDAVKINIKNKSRWSTLREVARKARLAGAAQLPRFTLPPFLSYAHFGTPLYLLSTGVTFSIKENIPNNTTSAAAAHAVDVILPRGLLATHRMPAYRSRVLEICRRYSEAAENLPNTHGEKISGGEVKETFDLAPQVKVTTAEAALPVLWAPSVTPETSSSSYSLSNLAVNPLRLRRPTVSAASKVPIRNNSGGVRRSNSLLLEKPTVTMRVKVQGKGLDTCTGASLHFPAAAGNGGAPVTVFGRALDVSTSKLSTMGSLSKILSRSSGNRGSVSGDTIGDGGGGGGGRSLIHALGQKFLPLSNRSTITSNQNDDVLPKIEFVFEVPPEALLQLQLLDPTINTASAPARMPTIGITLYSDFAKTPLSVQCIPQTAWILPLDTHLGDTIFSELTQAAQKDAEDAAARLLQKRSKLQKQQKDPSQQFNNDANTKGDEKEEKEPSRKAEGEALLSWREKILQRMRSNTNLPNTNLPANFSSPSPLRSVLYRGLLIVDISHALRESDDIKYKLQLAAELLQWTAQHCTAQQANDPSNSGSSKSQKDIWEDLSIPVQDHELDSLLQNHSNLSLGTRLKQQLRQAIYAVPPPPLLKKIGTAVEARQRQLLWEHLFKNIPHFRAPDVVVILTSGDILKHRMDKTGDSAALSNTRVTRASNISTNPIRNGSMLSNEFNLSLLDAVHAVAVASGQCHATALLAVAASEAKDPAYRRRLSFSSGLYGRPGAVVPIDWEVQTEEGKEIEQASLLNIRMLQAALLAHSSAAQISKDSQRQAREVNSEERTVKNALRARL